MKLEQADKGELGFGHDIPLCSQAVEVLRAIRQLTGRFDYVFPKATSWREPMTDSTLSGLYKRLEDGRYKGRMVPHGWRSAFSTLMNERAALLDQHGDRLVIDMALAHVPKGLSSSEWAYNRARYYKPRAALHEAWGGMITSGLCSPADLLAAYRGEGRGYGGARAGR